MKRTERNERLRVLLVAGCLGLGGAEKQIVLAARSLTEAGVKVEVNSFTNGDFYEQRLTDLGINCAWLGAGSLVRFRELCRMVRRFRPHIIHSGHLFVNVHVEVAGLIGQAITVGAMRGSLSHAEETVGRWLTRASIRLPDVLLVNSHAAVNDVTSRKLLTHARTCYVSNAVAVDHSGCVSSDPRRNYVTAVVIGRLDRNKRVDVFIQAISKARRRNPRVRGWVVGIGPELDRLETLVSSLGLAHDQLSFLGRRTDVPALLRQADMLVLCSETEGMPNVVLEAMSAALPIITTPAGDAASTVCEARCGCIVPFDDAESIAHCIVRLADANALRREMGESGRRYVISNCDIQSFAERLLLVYRSVALRRRNRRVCDLADMHMRVLASSARAAQPCWT